MDDRRDPHVFVRSFQQQEGALQSGIHLRTETVCEVNVVVFGIGDRSRHSTSRVRTFFLDVGTFWLLLTTFRDRLGV